MHAATSTQHDSHTDPVWFGMEIPSCSEGCGATVARAGDACGPCSSRLDVEERLEVRYLIAAVVDRGIPVSREAVAV
jgi:hypothetical protein